MPSLVILALACAVGYAAWWLFGAYFVRSPLDNIPGPARTSFLKGNYDAFFFRHAWDFIDSVSETYGAAVRIFGPFGTRGVYVSDPKALHNIIVKDQMIYEEPRWFLSWNSIVFGDGLLSTLGDHHRKQRKLLNPVFSIAHMRDMTPIFYETIHRLRVALQRQVGDSPTEVNVLNWMTRTALELVGQGGLGYSFDPLVEDVRNELGDALKDLVPTNFQLHFWRLMVPYIENYIPPMVKRHIGKWLPHAGMQKMRYIVETSQRECRHIFNSKMAALNKGDESVVHQIGEGKDILSILIRANMEAKDGEKLPEEEVIAQMSTLVFAATDTTSNALSRILHLIAQHPDVQDKMRAELQAVSSPGQDIPYDQLVDLPYLDAVCRETLRLYPPVSFLSREVRQDVVMPLQDPIHGVDGSVITEIPLPKDTTVFVAIRACNRNKSIWGDDALEWKPERWLSALPDSVGKAHVPGIYSNLMTFLGGGRACIGFKFSQLEMKVVLAVLLLNFKFHISKKDIVWNVAGVAYPTVGPVSSRSELPLVLEPIKWDTLN